MGVLGVLNRHYAWNMPGVREERNKQRVLTVDELPKLSLSGESSSNCTNVLSVGNADKVLEIQ